MKLKYYMRGMGFGIIVTSLIFLIAIAVKEPFQAPNTTSSEESTKQESTVAEEQQKDKKDKKEETDVEKDAETSEEAEEENASDVETTVDEQGNTTTVENIPGSEPVVTERVTDNNGEAKETVTVTIVGGEGSNAVGSKLQQAGLVDSGNRFNNYLEDNNYDNVIQPGTYTIPKGSTYEEVAEIITNRR
ncbi:MAG: endolytic transglycosylase MltG [Lachnospiraceae bacterium]|nr:endolytic transglycosylase MltG [Lachnospiraceae bacterium]